MNQVCLRIALLVVALCCDLGAQTKEYIRLNGRVIAIESPTTSGVTACAAASNVLSFRSTGNSGSALLQDGTVDPNWKMVSNPGSFGGISTTDAIVLSNMPGGGSTATAKFINATGTAGNVPPGAYIYRQKVDLSCHDPATVSISGSILADDNAQIYVNGKWQSTPPTTYNTAAAFSVSGSGGAFVRGWNQVDVVVMNTNVGEDPSGLRVEVASATAMVVSSASGAKFDVTATPAGGNKNGSSSVALSSGTENVTWAVDGGYTGTLTGASANAVSFAGPGTYSALTVVAVKATSTTDATRVSYQPLWFNGVGSVTISGSSTNLAPFVSRSMSATVSGVPNGQPTTVRWSVVSVPASSSSNGLIDTGTSCVAAMNYRAPSTIRTAGNIVLKAESCYNSAWTSTINIPVAVATSVTVSIPAKPATVTGSYAFAATVANADGTGVSWSVAPAAAGTITAAGVFTAASGYSGNATVTATSVENTSIADSAPFSVVVAVSITLSSSGATQSVIASGTANFPVTYSSTGTTGLVSFALLTPPAGANVNINPASVTNQGGASVTVSVSPGTSAAGTYAMTFRATNGTITQTLPLTLTVVDCGTITVSPANVNVYPFQMANFTAVRTGAAANFGVTWSRDTAAGSFSSQLDPPAVQHPQISYFAADPSTQPQTVVVTARTNNPASACSTFGGSATVTKQTYVPNGLSLLYTNPLSIVVPLNLSRFFDYGAASQNGAGTVRFVQLELRNNLGEVSDAATACAINFTTETYNNDPSAATWYALAKVANNGAAGGSADSTAIAPRGGSASTQVIGTSSLWNCELDGTGSDYVRSTNIFALHMKVKMKSLVFSPGTIHVYVRTYGSDLYEPAIRQYMGSFTTAN